MNQTIAQEPPGPLPRACFPQKDPMGTSFPRNCFSCHFPPLSLGPTPPILPSSPQAWRCLELTCFIQSRQNTEVGASAAWGQGSLTQISNKNLYLMAAPSSFLPALYDKKRRADAQAFCGWPVHHPPSIRDIPGVGWGAVEAYLGCRAPSTGNP